MFVVQKGLVGAGGGPISFVLRPEICLHSDENFERDIIG